MHKFHNCGEGHDSGGTTPCTGGTQVGWVMSVTSNGATTSEPMVLIDGSKVAGGGGGTPNAATPALYAASPSYGGSDSNDGLTPATPKSSIMSAYDDLPTSNLNGGTIYAIGPTVPACPSGSPSGCGIWIMGPGDPNYSSPPSGWRKAKYSYLAPISIIGIGGNDMPSFSIRRQGHYHWRRDCLSTCHMAEQRLWHHDAERGV